MDSHACQRHYGVVKNATLTFGNAGLVLPAFRFSSAMIDEDEKGQTKKRKEACDLARTVSQECRSALLAAFTNFPVEK